jgi:LysM repeat protein
MKPIVAHLLLVLCLSPLAFAQTESPQTEQAPAQTVAVHKVRPGDCFDKIARANSCSIADLAAINGLPTDAVLQIGQELKLPASTVASSAENIASPSQDSAPSNLAEPSSYTVKAGDTFSKIAKLHNVSVDSLIAANPTVKPTAMRLGQKIVLPRSEKTAEQAATEETSNETPTPETNEGNSANSETNNENVTASETNNADANVQATQNGNTTTPEASGGDEPNTSPATPEATDGTVNDADGGNANGANDGSSTSTERSARTIATEREMTYGELAAQYGTKTERLNSLNGLDLQPGTIVAKGADLLVPIGMSN